MSASHDAAASVLWSHVQFAKLLLIQRPGDLWAWLFLTAQVDAFNAYFTNARTLH